MKHYDLVVIGFGKAGKTLAAKMAALGKKVAIIEESAQMYGGTCINIGCIPTKTLIHAAEHHLSFEQAMQEKTAVTTRLRQKNFNMLDSVVDVYTAKAHFVSNKVVELTGGEETLQLEGEIIVINTGARSNVLPIAGLTTSQHVYDSTGIQFLAEQPKRLGIIGGGNIGLEFANLYSALGSEVTVFDASSHVLPREEKSIATLAKQYMEEQGIQFQLEARIQAVFNEGEGVVIETADGKYMFDVVLYATGRKPNTEGLNLEATDIEFTERGAIKVDEHCETTVKNVFAVGDVNGGPQFTYVSLDDFRIVYNYLTGDGSYTLNHRKNVPSTLFINPPLSRVGMTEQEAQEAGLNYVAKEMPVAGMPRAHVNADLRGAFKVIVDPETKQILGATLFGAESAELINLITMAMDNKIPYTYFQTQIFTHPTMAENFNDLFAI